MPSSKNSILDEYHKSGNSYLASLANSPKSAEALDFLLKATNYDSTLERNIHIYSAVIHPNSIIQANLEFKDKLHLIDLLILRRVSGLNHLTDFLNSPLCKSLAKTKLDEQVQLMEYTVRKFSRSLQIMADYEKEWFQNQLKIMVMPITQILENKTTDTNIQNIAALLSLKGIIQQFKHTTKTNRELDTLELSLNLLAEEIYQERTSSVCQIAEDLNLLADTNYWQMAVMPNSEYMPSLELPNL